MFEKNISAICKPHFAVYFALIRAKSLANWNSQLTKSLFQTRSRVNKNPEPEPESLDQVPDFCLYKKISLCFFYFERKMKFRAFLLFWLFLGHKSFNIQVDQIGAAPPAQSQKNQTADQIVQYGKYRHSDEHTYKSPERSEKQDRKKYPKSGDADPVAQNIRAEDIAVKLLQDNHKDQKDNALIGVYNQDQDR